MPVAIPTWRNVLLIPDAIPARRGSTTLTAVAASGAFTIPTATPPTRKPGSSVVQPDDGVTPCIKSRASPTSAIPKPSRKRTGSLAESRPAIGAVTKPSSDSGRKRTPA